MSSPSEAAGTLGRNSFKARRLCGLKFAVGAITLAGVVAAAVKSSSPMSAVDATLLGATEGITEFLPVSSTAHLLIVQRALGLDEGSAEQAADAFAIAIQFGAIMAVLGLYRLRIRQMFEGLAGRDAGGWRLLVNLLVAFVPSATVGLIAGDAIRRTLFSPWPIVAAWFVGGVVLLRWPMPTQGMSLDQLSRRSAMMIGLAQVTALWPGVSRSLVTMLAATLVGLSIGSAAEFSFLLGLITLGAATAFDLVQNGDVLISTYGTATPLLGATVALVTALGAMRWLVGFLRSGTMAVFGAYRIAAAGAAALLLSSGVL